MDAKISPLVCRPREAARLLQISTRTLQNWMRRGAIPWFRQGRCVFFPVNELHRWVEKRSAERQ